jgi:hypothetical protein
MSYHIYLHLPDPLTISPLTINPLTVNINLLPTRFHLPVDMSIGINLLGHELACIRLCGEAQLINEPYRPNPCEICEPLKLVPSV